jgi:hypothetical protein
MPRDGSICGLVGSARHIPVLQMMETRPTWMYYTMHVSEMSQRLRNDLVNGLR